jgi:hypothetical protein
MEEVSNMPSRGVGVPRNFTGSSLRELRGKFRFGNFRALRRKRFVDSGRSPDTQLPTPFQVAKQRPASDKGQPVHFSVPTGNFGDVLAGFYAKKMGLPIGKLVVGTNENDILARFFQVGDGGGVDRVGVGGANTRLSHLFL